MTQVVHYVIVSKVTTETEEDNLIPDEYLKKGTD